MNPRGEYRGIPTVIIDGPNFQELPPNARLLLFVLKLKLGPSAIGVIPAMVPALEEHTGLDGIQVQLALEVLQHTGWVRVERNVVWVIDGLKHEPSLQCTNENHRKSVESYLAGLPSLPIVAAFRRHYAAWLRGEKSPANGMGDGIGMASPIPSGSLNTETEDRILKTENRKTSTPRLAPRGLSEDEAAVRAHYLARHPRRKVTDQAVRRHAGAMLKHFTAEELCTAIDVNADDPWHVERGKHELSYVLRSVEIVSGWLARADDATTVIGANGNEAEYAKFLGVEYHGAAT